MRVLLSGYYGFGNAGDEAVLESLLGLIRWTWPSAEPTVLSNSPGQTTQRHGVRSVERWSLRTCRAELRNTDLFLSGGGTLFQDTTSLRSLFFYLGQLALAQRVGVPTAVAFQGLGPLRRRVARVAVRRVLNQVNAIVTRDADATALVDELHISAPHFTASDPALLLEPADDGDLARELQTLTGAAAGQPLLGVSLRPHPALDASLPVIIDALRHAVEALGAYVVLIPLSPTEDDGLCQTVCDALGRGAVVWSRELSPREWVELAAQCDAVVAMRLHALIFATAAGVPAGGLSYDPKVASFLRESGQLHLGQIGELEAGRLAEGITQLLAASEGRRAEICSARDGLRQRVREGMAWLASTCQQG